MHSFVPGNFMSESFINIFNVIVIHSFLWLMSITLCKYITIQSLVLFLMGNWVISSFYLLQIALL